MSQPIMSEVAPSAFPQDVKQRTLSLPANAFQQGLPNTQQLPLAPGWIEMRDPSGRPLYFNTASGATSWDRPAVQMLPPGWQQAQTPDGKAIFIHTASGTMSYSWPTVPVTAAAPAARPAPVQRKVSVPQAVQHTPHPDQKPQIVRAATLPVTAKVATGTGLDVQVNVGVPIKAIPGLEQAYRVHQISENNNVKVLSKKLASDMAETTTTAASLVTRQVKTVGKTMISAKKMSKACKKVVVQTGAISVKSGRACKVMMTEMVDAADGKGKYAPKRGSQYIPYTPSDAVNTPTSPTSVATGVTASGSVNISLNAGIPARKPLRKPVPNQQANQIPAAIPTQSPQQMGVQFGVQGQIQGAVGHTVMMQPTMTAQIQPNLTGSSISAAPPPPYHHAIQNQPNTTSSTSSGPSVSTANAPGSHPVMVLNDPNAVLTQPMAQLNFSSNAQASIHTQQTGAQQPGSQNQPSHHSRPSVSNPTSSRPEHPTSHQTAPSHNNSHSNQHQPHSVAHETSPADQTVPVDVQQPIQFTNPQVQSQPLTFESQPIYQNTGYNAQQAPLEVSNTGSSATITDFSQASYNYPVYESAYMPTNTVQPAPAIIDPQQANLMSLQQQPTTVAPTPLPQGGEIIYSESTFVDPSSGVAIAQEEIIYVDENGNVLADQAAAAAMFVDENGNSNMVLVEEQSTSIDGGSVVVTETEVVELEADADEEDGDCDFDF